MKTKVVLPLCAVMILGLVFSASAQMKAGSEEDRAFTKIDNEKNPDAQIPLLLDFEKQFGNTSKMMPTIYSMLMTDYAAKKDMDKANEFGEKAIKADPDNVDALIAVSRSYAMSRTNLTKAVDYAQRAVASVEKKRKASPPAGYTDAQWQQYLDSLDNSAKAQLNYAKSVHP